MCTRALHSSWHGKEGGEGDCARIGVTYQVKCLNGNALYIAETGRALNVLTEEHLAGKKQRSLKPPIGRHRNEALSRNGFTVESTIQKFEAEIPAKNELEAFWITVKNPETNRRNECLSITTDLLPFNPM